MLAVLLAGRVVSFLIRRSGARNADIVLSASVQNPNVLPIPEHSDASVLRPMR